MKMGLQETVPCAETSKSFHLSQWEFLLAQKLWKNRSQLKTVAAWRCHALLCCTFLLTITKDSTSFKDCYLKKRLLWWAAAGLNTYNVVCLIFTQRALKLQYVHAVSESEWTQYFVRICGFQQGLSNVVKSYPVPDDENPYYLWFQADTKAQVTR